jgi:hypothetical protein
MRPAAVQEWEQVQVLVIPSYQQTHPVEQEQEQEQRQER